MLTILLIALPLFAGVIVCFGSKTIAKKMALSLSALILILACYITYKFKADANSQFTATYPWINSLNINFAVGIDGISLLLVLLTSVLTPIIILSTFDKNIEKPNLFYALILLMEAALLGVFVAKDIFLFYFFFEAALLPIYFIVSIWGGPNRVNVSFKFLVYTIFGSLFMLVGLVYLYFQTPGEHSSLITDLYNLKLNNVSTFNILGKSFTLNNGTLVFWAIFLAFAIKMPIFPFHTWQPDTYVESPSAGTMLLSGIMLKMGTYGLIRILLPIVPQATHQFGNIAIILCIIGIIYGSIIAIQQTDIKRLIAYSSFSHVGLMAAGIFSITLFGLQGSLIQMFE
jgi:NADH-quinone oxidoreductase subunit M